MRMIYWAVLTASVAAIAAVGSAFGDEFHLGFGADSNASPQEVGLPAYPGAKVHKDKDGDSGGKVWGGFGAFGMKIAAAELESNDQSGRIAGFYKDALRKYGPVLDCSPGQPRPPKAAENSDRLDCGDDHPKPGSFLFKAGVKQDFHVVGIEPEGPVNKISLVSIKLHGVH